MINSTTSLAYRKAALQHASTAGLIIALYDTLLGNLSRAASAMDRDDIEGRCAELTHGFKVLQQLEVMANEGASGQAATNLRRFYTYLRGQMLAAQFKRAPAILREQIKMVIEVRGAWQQVDMQGAQSMEAGRGFGARPDERGGSTLHPGSEESRLSFSCAG